MAALKVALLWRWATAAPEPGHIPFPRGSSFLSRTKMAEAACTWNDNETEVLIKVWADSQIQKKLDSSSRNILVFAHIGKILVDEHIIVRSAIQCR